ncbi:M3 family oligoendopeptidase [Rhodocytophaga aerolata]|uniref:M3 family oligoendopeptidase n=1 Tax=Rhodocytophaga aerolata TaxID=455078 RepID=A0ABT8RA63_9BACT|nr:M3 family oligoendopeptidase [Rhodocytophaga aerolata]MDO1447595.1 M3 family oligoendopeptidase [Rhodocytophaga aerolata]
MPETTLSIPQRKQRTFLPDNFQLITWESIQPFVENLKYRPIHSAKDLQHWFEDRSELEAYLAENFAWRYIRMTCDTANEQLVTHLQDFITNIQPKIAPETNALNEKALLNEYLTWIKAEGFEIMIRSMKKDFEIFREKNIPVITQIQTEERKYGAIAGEMTVEIDGKELTLQQASDFLQSTNRAAREEAYKKIAERRYQDKDKLDELFNKLIQLRHQQATNADFKNFRDYMFAALGRFDYTPEDCFAFHTAVAESVVPLLNEMAQERKEKLKLDILRPWDTKVDISNKPALKPFTSGEELINKTIECFTKLDPYLGQCLAIMKQMGHLDLESRKGKAPGGYNYPLDEIGVPFIFMNATSSLRDMVTMLHEGGHAVHSFLTRDLSLNAYKHPPSEVAELASMSMELISMDHWNLFFESEEDLRRAKRQHLEQIIETLPWVATIDKFQHWIYEHPTHTVEERKHTWLRIYEQFSDSVTDWAGLEEYKAYIWQKQLHLYEVPFYYIEYGIAQLGAIAVWKNYKENPQRGLQGYINALKLGYTKPISQIYEAAYIPFNFSKEYITELISFVKTELEKVK